MVSEANCQLSSQPWCECQAIGHFAFPAAMKLVDSCSMLKSPSAGSFTVVLMVMTFWLLIVASTR